MARKAGKESNEKLQIAILTLAMTGGGFALLTMVLAFYLNPAAGEVTAAAQKEYKELVKLLESPDMKNLRAQAKLSEGQEGKRDLRQVISEAMSSRQLQQGNFPAAKITEGKGGMQKVEQSIDLKSAKLLQIFQFLGDVLDAKKTIRAESLTLTRERRSQQDSEGDSWGSTLRFVDYVQQQK